MWDLGTVSGLSAATLAVVGLMTRCTKRIRGNGKQTAAVIVALTASLAYQGAQPGALVPMDALEAVLRGIAAACGAVGLNELVFTDRSK